jgi:uncharacterized protein YjdB
VRRVRPFIAPILVVMWVCLASLWPRPSQSDSVLRRITNTAETGISLNPAISGDGRQIAFESTEDLANAGGAPGFHAIHADLTTNPTQFVQMGLSRAVTPAISQNGSRIAFASTSDLLGKNVDGNSEIFLFDGSLKQITDTTPGGANTRVQDGNFQPSMTDNGRFIAFSSNRNLAGQNADGNLEAFVFDTSSQTFTPVTNTLGVAGAGNVKVSGDGSHVAYVRDRGTDQNPNRDLVIFDRAAGSTQPIAVSVNSVALTSGRAISDDGTRVVYALQTATNTTQVFLFDARANGARQITSLTSRATDVPLDPTISGDGKRIAFATRRNPLGTNSDASVELFLYDIPTGQLAQLTNSTKEATAEVVSSLNDDGSVAVFNFPRVLTGAVANSDYVNNSEIYSLTIAARASSGTATILNGASLQNDPASPKAIAPDSIVVAQGGALASVTQQAQPLSDGSFPLSVGGTSVTVNGRPAQVLYVSPGQVIFVNPRETAVGPANVVITNSEGFQSTGSIMVLSTAPGVFTISGDGSGEGVILNADTLVAGPFDPTNSNLRLIIFATGARRGSHVTATIAGQPVTVESLVTSQDLPGLDEIHVLVPASLRGLGALDVAVQSDNQESNSVGAMFSGSSLRDIVINEVLADPPVGAAGDANHDGVRSSSQDEFVELVNATTHDIDISGYRIRTSGLSGAGTVRHVFATGTIFPAGAAIVVFGGANVATFNPNDPAFGGAMVLTASTAGLSLVNSGGVVTLEDTTGTIVNLLAYGGSSGLDGQANQSITRSPDVTGDFALHQSASGSNGRSFSPGTHVDGSPFLTIAISRIDVTPATATIDVGAHQQFAARAFASSGQEIFGVIFVWQSSNMSVATIDQNGLATAAASGSTGIRASGRGVQSAPATLTVRDVMRVLTRIDVLPSSAAIPVGGAQQFTAHGFDQFGNEITGLTFTWESTNTTAATIDQNGLATGANQGRTTTIRASAQGVTGTASLSVTPPTVIMNEALADPPGSVATDLQGDANHDGVRSASDDEFVELINSTAAAINISSWTLRTRATGGTSETTRHTFAVGSTLPAGEAMVVFGGGNFDHADQVFGCAQVVKASSGGLSLTNSGLTILVRDGSGTLIAQFSYGGSTGLNGDNDQSLTRSPDITGNFVQHMAATGANGRRFTPGLKVDGTPFGNCPARLTSITISPPSASVIVGQSMQFTAHAFDQFGRPMTALTITFASDNTNTATVDSVTTDPNTGIATATVTGRNQGPAHITASTTDGTTTVASSQATLTVNPIPPRATRVDVSPASATINRGNTQQFTATAFDQNNQPLPTAIFTWTSSNLNVATVDTNGLAKGVGVGTVTITATTSDGQGGNAAGTATLNVQVPLVINEINADVAPDNVSTPAIEGDSNRDGVRDSDDDEFAELLNNSNASVDLSGVIISDATSNRFTFPANTTLAAGRAVVIFGGGTPPANDPAFGGALILTTGTLSLNDTGDTVNVKLPVGGTDVVIATQGYGGTSGVPAPSDQSLTRSPDAEIGTTGGNFGAHTSAANAAGRTFSPGTRADGTPFGSPAITRVEVTPASASINIGATQPFVARAFSNTGGPEVEVLNVCFIWDSSDTSKATIAPATGRSTTATAVASGDTTIRARASGQENTAMLTINPTLSISDVTLNEGNSGATTFTFTVSLSTPAPTGGVTFDIATQDNTATVADNDYIARSLTGQTIAAGTQTYNFDVTVNGDLNIEPNETFFVNVTNVSGATIADGQGVGTIQNDDSPVLSINDVSANEGDSGTTVFSFTVSSSLPAPAGGITFDIATQNNTASVANNDYVAHSLTGQTIAAGQTSYSFDVTVNGDTLVEPNETFFVNLTNVSGATIGDGQGVGTIQNDDTANLVISQVYAGGGNSGAQFTNDFVEVFNRGTTTVNLATTSYSIQYAGATATFGSSKVDLTSGAIAPGHYFLVQLSSGGANGVALPTPDATGSINMAATAGKVALVVGTTSLTGSGCPLGATVIDFVGYGTTADCFEGSGRAPAPSNTTADFRKSGGCTDTNDNAADFLVSAPFPRNTSSPTNNCIAGAPPNLTINDVTVSEGNSGTVTATFTVGLSAPAPSTDIFFDIATQDNAATTANNDYVAKSLTNQVIPAGQQTYSFSVVVNGDTAIENDETFFVNVTNVSGATLLDGQGVGTIQNDDLPTLSINDVTLSEGNSGPKTFTFTVSLSAAAPTGGVTFDIATQDNTATVADNDYVSRSLTGQTIPAGQQTYNFDVTVNGDLNIEPNETFFVNVTNVSGATVSDGQGVGTIQNDDSPALSINDVAVNEGDNGTTTFTFTVSLSLPAPAGGVTFDIATQDNTATTANSDYVAKNLTAQTIPAGQQTYNFDVTINDDTVVEPNETFFVNVTNVSGATVSDGQGQGTIQNDDTANLVISQIYGAGGNAGATYQNDFIEIFNRGTTTVNLSGWSVQYVSATGTGTWSVTNLSGTIQPGQYYLVQESSGGAVGSPLPTPDATGTIVMAATAGKVALLNTTTALAGGCPSSANIFDLVGYGTTASCFEGSGPAPAPSATNADIRGGIAGSGCTDTNNNATDFVAAPVSPHNTSSPTHSCP